MVRWKQIVGVACVAQLLIGKLRLAPYCQAGGLLYLKRVEGAGYTRSLSTSAHLEPRRCRCLEWVAYARLRMSLCSTFYVQRSAFSVQRPALSLLFGSVDRLYSDTGSGG
jgi:hypothetical protein